MFWNKKEEQYIPGEEICYEVCHKVKGEIIKELFMFPDRKKLSIYYLSAFPEITYEKKVVFICNAKNFIYIKQIDTDAIF